MMVDKKRLAELRAAWSAYPGYEPNGFKEALDTIDALLKVARDAERVVSYHFPGMGEPYPERVSALIESLNEAMPHE